MKTRAFWVGVLGGAVASLLVGLFAVPALGLFEMTATGDPGFLDWWGNTNWKSSLQWRAPDEQLPQTADPSNGLTHYASSCLQCHGAPGVGRAEWAHRMQPMPPKLWEKGTQNLSDGDLFHIVRGGVRMTGMPAFGPDHQPEEIWNMVAFIRQLNDLSPEQKSRLEAAAEAYRHEHDHGAGHPHGAEKTPEHGRPHSHGDAHHHDHQPNDKP